MINKKIPAFAKLLNDDKVSSILEATKSPEGKTTKEISKETGIPNNQLYYTINKMINADLLDIIDTKKVKNLIEYYYSSYSITSLDSKLGQEINGSVKSVNNISYKWSKAHKDEVLSWVSYRHQLFIEALQEELSTDIKKENELSVDTSFSTDEVYLSKVAEKKLWNDIIKLISEAEKNDYSGDKNKINILIEKW